MIATTADLARRLCESGAMPANWQSAFAAVDRAAFIPRRAWFDDHDGVPRPIEYGTEEWARAVYSDEPIVTQLDEGRISWPDSSRLVTSSASQPSVVLRILEALDLQQKPVLEALRVEPGRGDCQSIFTDPQGENKSRVVVTGIGGLGSGEALPVSRDSCRCYEDVLIRCWGGGWRCSRSPECTA